MHRLNRGVCCFLFKIPHKFLKRVVQINHGKVAEQLEDADFVLFSHQTDGIEGLLQDGRIQGKPALDVNWIHRCRGVERIVPWYSFQIGTRNLALTKLSVEARDEHEMVLFMARYGPVLTLKQSFEKLERMVRRQPNIYCPPTDCTPVSSSFGTEIS
jgi:hypothetical protein